MIVKAGSLGKRAFGAGLHTCKAAHACDFGHASANVRVKAAKSANVTALLRKLKENFDE
ncbi:MAG: hypothetical protein HS116_07820 [Planctomycetes bacterium]|nr:hypothetical protein [Planctomycetota bacterium]